MLHKLVPLWLLFFARCRPAVSDTCASLSGSPSCSSIIPLLQGKEGSDLAQPIRAATCDFRDSRCGYTQGCKDAGAPSWIYNDTEGYFEMRAVEDGFYNRTSDLESPLLDIQHPSCLSFNASFQLPVRVAAVLATPDTHCTLIAQDPFANGGIKTFRANLPAVKAKILFQGFHGGDTKRYARLFNVTLRSGCCQDLKWLTVGKDPHSPLCGLNFDGWEVINTTTEVTAHVKTDVTSGTLETALIGATDPGSVDCLHFEYFLSNVAGNSLSVWLEKGDSNDCILIWRMENTNGSGAGLLAYFRGQVQVESEHAYKIRFTGIRGNTTDSAIVRLRNVIFDRSVVPCTLSPQNAQPPHLTKSCKSSSQQSLIIGGIVGGVVVIVFVIVAVIVGIIFCRRHTRSSSDESSKARSPMPMEVMMSDGRQCAAYQNVEVNETTPPPHVTQSEGVANQAFSDDYSHFGDHLKKAGQGPDNYSHITLPR